MSVTWKIITNLYDDDGRFIGDVVAAGLTWDDAVATITALRDARPLVPYQIRCQFPAIPDPLADRLVKG